MTLELWRERRLVVLAAIAWISVASAVSAQAQDQRLMTTPSLSAVAARVPAGGVVYVTDATGATIKGTLNSANDDTVQVRVGTQVRSLAAADVRRIRWRQPDSPFTGVVIGAGIGAIPGIYWLAADPNECHGMCSEEYGFIAVGALIGGLIDHAIKRKVTVYEAGASRGRVKAVMISPLVMQGHTGALLSVAF